MNAFWWAIGLGGQAAFASRFLAQWIASERARKSVVPIQFWFLSVVGGALLLVYAVHIKDPVFILGQSLGMFVYARNLSLLRRDKEAREQGA